MKHNIPISWTQAATQAGGAANVGEWTNNLGKEVRVFGIRARANAQAGPTTNATVDVRHKGNNASMLTAGIEVVAVAQANLNLSNAGTLTTTTDNLRVAIGETIQVRLTVVTAGGTVTGGQVDIAAYGG